jgi:phosphatidylinositol alpha-1,6-mannosyltransferase
MRVLFLTDSLSDLDGVGRYTVRLLTALEKESPDLAFEILLARKHRPTSADVPARWKVSVALPPDYFVRMRAPVFWASLLASSLRVARAARRADLVHAIKDYPHSLSGLLGARFSGVPCIATAHGTYSVQPLFLPRHRRLLRWTYRRLAALIAVSGHTRDRLVGILGQAGLPTVRVIPNAVEAASFATPSAFGPRPWHGQSFTLSIGELKERKGHHLSIQAFARAAEKHPELHHYVVGKGSADAYETGLRETVRRAGLAERVRFLGNVSEAEKVDLLQRARLFLLTPVTAADGGFEGFGLVYLEAAACGVPSIGTRGSGAEDAIVDGETGLLVEPQVDAIEAALERLLSDGALARRLGEGARKRARASSWEENARNVVALYRTVLARQATPPAGAA